ncbi:MAG: dihydroorotate dehydrogenase [Bdellovibrionales bacterium]|nr:dihydroorotate dehydrogenase [Bdellovibrionales bacterium]
MSAVDLSVSVGDLKFKNPLIGASGTFGYGLEFASLYDLSQIGGFVTKGLSLRPREGNPPHRIAESSSGMINSIGLNNIGVEVFLREKLPQLTQIDTHIIVNVYGQDPEDFVAVARELKGVKGISALEVNVSCPNVDKGGLDLGTEPIQVQKLLERISKACDKPLWAKLTPNVTSIVEIAQAAADGGAQALSLINSVKATAVDLRSKSPILSRVYGGLSGPAIKPIALAKVLEVAMKMEIPIVGMGGISTGEDVLEFLLCGAHAVQIGTQNFVRSDAMWTIKKELELGLERFGSDTIGSWVRGLSVFS